METMKWTEKDFIDGIDYTQAGIVGSYWKDKLTDI